MRIGVYGGSFNPPHIGHGMVAGWLRWSGVVDEVWLVPTPAHPFAKDLVDYPQRVRMCEALAEVVGPWVKVSTIESELPRPNYTINTLRTLAERHVDKQFRLVVGADTIPEWPKWREWEAIESGFRPIVVGRQGYPAPEGAVSFPNISSTEVRSRLRIGEDCSHLVPASVSELIGKLYQE